MKLHEFCALAGIQIELTARDYGYCIALKDYHGFIWPELEHLAEKMDGGTTWGPGKGDTPNDAIRSLCASIQGRLLRFSHSEEKERPYRHIRAPLELTL